MRAPSLADVDEADRSRGSPSHGQIANVHHCPSIAPAAPHSWAPALHADAPRDTLRASRALVGRTSLRLGLPPVEATSPHGLLTPSPPRPCRQPKHHVDRAALLRQQVAAAASGGDDRHGARREPPGARHRRPQGAADLDARDRRRRRPDRDEQVQSDGASFGLLVFCAAETAALASCRRPRCTGHAPPSRRPPSPRRTTTRPSTGG